MRRTFLALLLAVSGLSITVFAQASQPAKPMAIRVGIGGGFLDPDSRPRVANVEKVAAVKSSVIANTASFEKAAFDMINQKRAEQGLKPLEWSGRLLSVARTHSQNMAEYDFFSHKGLDGKYVSDRADDAQIGTWRLIGENIAFNRGFNDPVAKAVELWLNSATHRRNLLNPDWRETAVGIAIGEDGSYYFTQVFLVRK